MTYVCCDVAIILRLLFVWFDSLRPNNLSVIKGRVFLCWTSTKLGLMFLLKDTTQWRRWGSNPRPFGLESSTLPLSHCAPKFWDNSNSKSHRVPIPSIMNEKKVFKPMFVLEGKRKDKFKSWSFRPLATFITSSFYKAGISYNEIIPDMFGPENTCMRALKWQNFK